MTNHKQLLLVIFTLCGCSSAPNNSFKGDEFEVRGQKLEECSIFFDRFTLPYRREPRNLLQISQMAIQISKESSALRRVLVVKEHGYKDFDLDKAIKEANKTVRSIRDNSIRVLGDNECSDAADEYLSDSLFAAASDEPSALRNDYSKYENRIGYNQFLLLALSYYMSQESEK